MNDERIRVIRVLEFVGPKEWIETTLGRSYVTGDISERLGEGREARELLRMQVSSSESNAPYYLPDLDTKYRAYCKSRDDRYPDEEYLTDRKFAERYVGDFLDWLENRKDKSVVRYYRKANDAG